MKRPIFIHILLFAAIVAVWAVVVSTSGAPPHIEKVEPEAANAGEPIVIIGENFGESRGRGHVRISGVSPNRSDYQSWNDERIVVRVPEETASGLVHVHTGNGTSNAAVFRNRATTPQARTDVPTGVPEITEVSPTRVRVGDILTLTGDHFGDIRGGGSVLFRAAPPDEMHPLLEPKLRRRPSVRDRSYVSWTDTRIGVRVPATVSAGEVRVETRRGRSPGVQLELDRSPGRKVYTDPRTVAVQHELAVTIRDTRNDSENNDPGVERLYFWFPRPTESGRQRRIQELSRQGPEPIYQVEGADLYRLDEPLPGSSHVIRATTLVDVYAVSTEIDTLRIRTSYDPTDEFVRRYTRASRDLPRDNELVRSLAAFSARAGRNPYKQAEAAFNRLVTLMTPVEEIGNIDAPTGLATGEGNAYSYATAFVAALRANGIPSRPVAGVLLREDGVLRHYWAEFYLYGIGWVPADPAAADDLHGTRSAGERDAADYFASLPADRVAFSRGVLETPPMVPDSTRIRVPEMYFLADHHEEVVGDPAAYRLVWRNLRLIGIY